MTNLKGTKWTFDENLKGFNETHSYRLNILLDNGEEFEQLIYYSDTGLMYLRNDAIDVITAYSILDGTGSWTNQIYRTITITGGDDIENASAIAMLQAMAVLESSGDEPEIPVEMKYKTVGELLSGIGDAIRNKKGTSDKINAQNMPDEIRSIEGSGGSEISGVIRQYKVNAGEKVNAGDFVEFVNNWGGGYIENYDASSLCACKIDEERIVILYTNGTYFYLKIMSIKDGIVKVGNSVQITNTSGSGSSISIVAIDSERVFITYNNYGLIVLVNDDNITLSESVSILQNDCTKSYNHQSFLVEDKIVIKSLQYNGTNYYSYLTLYEVNGNIISFLYNYQTGYSSASFNLLAVKIKDNQILTYQKHDAVVYQVNYNTIVVLKTNNNSSSNYDYTSKGLWRLNNTIVIHMGSSYRQYYGTTYHFYAVESNDTGIRNPFASAPEESFVPSDNYDLIALNETNFMTIRWLSNYSTAYIDLYGVITSSITKLSSSSYELGTNLQSKPQLILLSKNKVLLIGDNGTIFYKTIIINEDNSVTVDEDSDYVGLFVQRATSNLVNVGVAKTSGIEGETIEVYKAKLPYSISYVLSNATILSKHNYIFENDTLTMTIVPEEGYTINNVTAIGCEYVWDNSNNKLTISNATSDVNITVTVEEETPTSNLLNVTINGENATATFEIPSDKETFDDIVPIISTDLIYELKKIGDEIHVENVYSGQSNVLLDGDGMRVMSYHAIIFDSVAGYYTNLTSTGGGN